MRVILIMIFSFLCLFASGQDESLQGRIENSGLKNSLLYSDTIPFVEYADQDPYKDHPAYFIRGKFFEASITKTLNLQMIDSIDIKYDKAVIKDKIYNGQIHLTMKDEYNPKLITLHDFKMKYIKPTGRPAIFLINNNVIKDDYKSFLVDEKYILKIVVDSVVNENKAINVDIIRLITRTEENIKEFSKISIRGASEENQVKMNW